MASTTELIKEKIDVVEFLRGYLTLGAAGKNFKALCPFHKEKTPSFMVSPERQSWHCFGCGIGGDIFGFLMRYENLEFGEALRVLAEKAGVELRRVDPAEHKFTGLLYDLNDKAKDFFKFALKNYAPAKKYLEERGLLTETIETFELGWAPNEPEALAMHFLKSGVAPDDVVRAGLAVKTDRGMLRDRFRGRIMFPIHNHFGKVVGFTGRVLLHEGPEPVEGARNFSAGSTGSPQASPGFVIAKYVNSPETPIFNKSRLLYGFWQSKNHIRDASAAFLVEGQMDFLMSLQAGIKNVVASSGTALTPDHLRTLRRLADTLIISFDSDEAGSAASERAIDLAEASDFGVKVVAFANFKDPAEAAQAGPEKLLEAVKNAQPAPQFYFEKYLSQKASDYASREEIKNVRVVLGKIKNIASPIERGFWFKELAKRTGIEEKILTEEAEKVEVKQSESSRGSEEPQNFATQKSSSRRELIGERLLRAAVAKSDYVFMEECAPYLTSIHKNLFGLLKSGTRKSEDPGLDDLMNFIVLGSADLASDEIGNLKQELFKEHIKGERGALVATVKRAEAAGDEAGLETALRELNSLPSSSPILES